MVNTEDCSKQIPGFRRVGQFADSIGGKMPFDPGIIKISPDGVPAYEKEGYE